jgi:hypothetical protein
MTRTQALAQIEHGQALIRAGQEAIDAAQNALAQIDADASPEELQAARSMGMAAPDEIVEAFLKKIATEKAALDAAEKAKSESVEKAK